MENECDAMIRATRYNKTTTKHLLDVLKTKGAIAVYNLGMSDMFQYLSGSMGDNKYNCFRREFNKTVCYGTREKDECSCDGDKNKCDLYKNE